MTMQQVRDEKGKCEEEGQVRGGRISAGMKDKRGDKG
jgi:hypothetical protein